MANAAQEVAVDHEATVLNLRSRHERHPRAENAISLPILPIVPVARLDWPRDRNQANPLQNEGRHVRGFSRKQRKGYLHNRYLLL